jgi:ribosomal protein S18 acetylase RimI-like enzyme
VKNIRHAETAPEIEHARQLFLEYAAGLGIDLCFQNFEAEVDGLPGRYAAPSGRLLVAWDGLDPVGCVALRPLEADACEMKRLYVRPGARGGGLGRTLVDRICEEAREAGYARICLDTLPSMRYAIKLYESLGFDLIKPYVFNPVPGAMFFARDLRTPR